MSAPSLGQAWPELQFEHIQPTLSTLHHWLQIVGKIRLRTMPWQNHSWHTALYVSPHGYSTGSIPCDHRVFRIDFDFERHRLAIQCTGQEDTGFALEPMTVADFYQKLFDRLEGIGIHVDIHAAPNEVDPAIPFAENTQDKSYDPTAANNLWQAMLKANHVFHRFRSAFVGKSSPVHLFWGAFDLAVTRFSGNDAPLHPGGMPNMPLEVMQEAYSKEVSSAGFWPGSPDFPFPAFYAYAYPSTPAFGQQPVKPAEAFWSADMGEFFLKYEDVQRAEDPEQTLLDFLQTTYEAAANTSGWDRAQLELNPPQHV